MCDSSVNILVSNVGHIYLRGQQTSRGISTYQVEGEMEVRGEALLNTAMVAAPCINIVIT